MESGKIPPDLHGVLFLAFFRFRIIHAEGFNGHGLDLLLVQRAVAVIGVGISDLVYDIHALGDFSESGISAIQMRSSLVHDEELASGGVGMHGSCHGKNACLMLQGIVEAVLVELAFDVVSRAAHTGSIRAAALDHETADNAVEDQSIIEALLYEADEIVYGVGSNLRIKLRFHNVAIGHGNGNDRILCHNIISFVEYSVAIIIFFRADGKLTEALYGFFIIG